MQSIDFDTFPTVLDDSVSEMEESSYIHMESDKMVSAGSGSFG